jgi:hypothetical protein
LLHKREAAETEAKFQRLIAVVERNSLLRGRLDEAMRKGSIDMVGHPLSCPLPSLSA